MKNHVSSCVKTNLPTLVFLTMPSQYTAMVYSRAEKSLTKAIAECAANALYGEIEFKDEERAFLRTHIKELQKLSQGKKIDPQLVSAILAPIISYVCESTAVSDLRDVRGSIASGGSDEGNGSHEENQTNT